MGINIIIIIMMPSKLETIKNKLILGLLRILTTNRNSENIKNMDPAIASYHTSSCKGLIASLTGWSHF